MHSVRPRRSAQRVEERGTCFGVSSPAARATGRTPYSASQIERIVTPFFSAGFGRISQNFDGKLLWKNDWLPAIIRIFRQSSEMSRSSDKILWKSWRDVHPCSQRSKCGPDTHGSHFWKFQICRFSLPHPEARLYAHVFWGLFFGRAILDLFGGILFSGCARKNEKMIWNENNSFLLTKSHQKLQNPETSPMFCNILQKMNSGILQFATVQKCINPLDIEKCCTKCTIRVYVQKSASI